MDINKEVWTLTAVLLYNAKAPLPVKSAKSKAHTVGPCYFHKKSHRECTRFLLVAFAKFGFPAYYVVFGVLWLHRK